MVRTSKDGQHTPRSLSSPALSERSDKSTLSEKARGKQRAVESPTTTRDSFDTASEGSSSRPPTPPPKDSPKTRGLAAPRASQAKENTHLDRKIFADRHEVDGLLAFIKTPGGAHLSQQLTQLRNEAELVVTLHAKMRKPGWQQTPAQAQAHDLDQLDQALDAATKQFFAVRSSVMASLATPQGQDPEDLAHRLSHTLMYPEVLTAKDSIRTLADTEVRHDIETHRTRLGGGFLVPQEQLIFGQRQTPASSIADSTSDDEDTLIESQTPPPAESPKKSIHFLLPERPFRPGGRQPFSTGARGD